MCDLITIGWLGLPTIDAAAWRSVAVDTNHGGWPALDLLVADADVIRQHEPIDKFCARTEIEIPCLLVAADEQLDALVGFTNRRVELLPRDVGTSYFRYRVSRFAESVLEQRDALTGLLDRVTGFRKARRLLERASMVSAVMIDLDHFKNHNDNYGHAAGDDVLQQIGSSLLGIAASGAIVSRFGGEEFLIILERDEAGAARWAESARQVIGEMQFAGGARITASFGVGDNSNLHDLKELIARADESVYAAKGNGRNQVVRYTQLQENALQSGADIEIIGLETRTRVVTDRVANYVAMLSGRLLTRARREAETDGLTGVYNRRSMDRRLETAMASDGNTLAVALIDLDHFGEVNKQHGWPSGDKVLREACDVVRSVLREHDWIGRYGGEEFCVVLPNTSLADATEVMERLRATVEEHEFQSTNGESLTVTASIGVVEREPSGESASHLLERVSAMALTAKRNGRNQVVQELVSATE